MSVGFGRINLDGNYFHPDNRFPVVRGLSLAASVTSLIYLLFAATAWLIVYVAYGVVKEKANNMAAGNVAPQMNGAKTPGADKKDESLVWTADAPAGSGSGGGINGEDASSTVKLSPEETV